MGTLVYLGEAGYNVMFTSTTTVVPSPNPYADPSFIGNYIVGGVLIGYIAGGLNKGSLTSNECLGAESNGCNNSRHIAIWSQHDCFIRYIRCRRPIHLTHYA